MEWTLESARKDYKKKKQHENCYYCNFYKIEKFYNNWWDEMENKNCYYVRKCEVKEENIENMGIAKNCEYFTHKI